MKDRKSERVEPLDFFDIWRCLSDAMNLRDLRWLLYDEQRSTQWIAELQRENATRVRVDPEELKPGNEEPVPASKTAGPKETPSPKRAARAPSVKSSSQGRGGGR